MNHVSLRRKTLLHLSIKLMVFAVELKKFETIICVDLMDFLVVAAFNQHTATRNQRTGHLHNFKRPIQNLFAGNIRR